MLYASPSHHRTEKIVKIVVPDPDDPMTESGSGGQHPTKLPTKDLTPIPAQDAKGVMDEWRTRLSESSNSHLKSISDCDDSLTFWSVHQHEASGVDMNTKHIGVSMYYASPLR